MNQIIENQKLKLTVSEHGAEIKSLIRKSDNREMMWQADAAFWGRTSPVLFPVVGCYYQKKSIYDDNIYEMGQHGFARDMDFTFVAKEDNKLTYELTSNEETHEKYPFDFKLTISYILEDSTVKVCWKVENTDYRRIHFSIGAHPAFNCSLDTDYLLFEKAGKPVEAITANVIANDGSGCLSDEQDIYKLEDGLLKMSDEVFSKDALVIEDKQADMVTILDSDKKPFVKVTCPTPLFGVWSPVGKHAPFVCIEPWYGRCDRVGFNQMLEEREYGNSLNPKDEFNSVYEITVC